MKLRILKFLTVTTLVAACSYEFPEQDPDTIPSKGNADFSKTVTVGSSLTAGLMNGALYTAGQDNSFAAILAKQLKIVGGGEFNQPDADAENGCYDPKNTGCAVGRLYLKATPDNSCPDEPLVSTAPAPKIPGQPVPMTAYAGDKSKLNNFSAYGITVGTSLLNLTSGPSTANPYFNAYFARFAATPGTSTLISDASTALSSGGTFFVFWLGTDDVLGYALNGADQADPTAPLTSKANFTTSFNAAFTTFINANENAKGVVANIPDVTSIPHFSTVAYNVVEFRECDPVDVGTIAQLNGPAAYGGFNAALDGLAAATVITQEEANKRKVTFAIGKNAVVIKDESLVDLSGALGTINAGLAPFGQVRQATAADMITLSAGSVIPTGVGVSSPLPDKYVLIKAEQDTIQKRIDEFNVVISNAVSANSSRVALADINQVLEDLKASGSAGIIVNGLSMNATILPPYGAFSLDGVHPNARGNAYLANKFIQVINTKFEANVPLTNPNDYPGNDLPIP